jgi:hypothetical protein
MKAKFFKEPQITSLLSLVSENLDLYRSGNFDTFINNPDNYFETQLEIDELKLAGIVCDADNQNEIDNCILVFEAISGITNYLARDGRFWTFLTHSALLKYARNRWPIPEDNEKAIKHIKNHFFCIGARGIERDNASSRIWWMANLCSRVKCLNLRDSLSCMLLQSDVRASIIERPTTSQNITLFTAILKKLHDSGPDSKLFERDKFRDIMKWLNIYGGVKLIGALSEDRISSLLDECIAKAG